ncbi:alcohol dehydrogenase catalytic domain-containing protein [Clostridium estertheticum]|uniref:alcohol dehydrogenase catalytic domain-containing protein n=1 Tax=Clostridium estertheticum TaxID=238834 RepID=UPI001CF46804|nr:zinc-binding dehydrogenase [Clostridium estertheticum]MCB2360908.1 zinc-binding dehydrogenase [Clostridium estertheticum]
MNQEMQAIRLTQACSIEELKPTAVNRPEVKPGHALVKVKAFGVNESEVTSRKGLSSADFCYPRILGIEGVGVIEEVAEDSQLKVGQQVATMMSGLGRAIDGSYAEYMLIAESNLIAFESKLPWEILGAVPEMVQTAYGSLTTGLNLKKGDTLLIHGGTSTVGITAAVLAKSMGATVLSTSRKLDKFDALKSFGVDFPILDDKDFADKVREIAPRGVDKILELVGTNVVPQDMALLKAAGKLCFTGALNNTWTFDNFSPYQIPFGKYFTSYAGGVSDLPSPILNDILRKIEEGESKLPIAKVYQGLEEVGEAQANLESGQFIGKHVVVL